MQANHAHKYFAPFSAQFKSVQTLIGAFHSPIVGFSFLLLFVLLSLSPSPARAQSILSDGSFEQGSASWTMHPTAVRSSEATRTGKHGLEARTSKTAQVAISAPVKVSAEQSYRLTGFVRSTKGRARLGMNVLDGAGKILERVVTPWVKATKDWLFTAVERDMPSGAASVRVWIEAQGHVYLDDLMLAPMKVNLVFNPTFDVDNRGRVSMWTEEPAGLLEGKRAGSLKGDSSGGRHGAALLVEPAQEAWFGARMIPAALPTGIRDFRAEGWSRSEGSRAEIRVVWLDKDERLIRVDRVSVTGSEGNWHRHDSIVTAPPRTTYVTMVALARGGQARFDDFSFMQAAPARRKEYVVEVFVNQVGYERTGPKSAVVASNFFPQDTPTASIDVVDQAGRSVLTHTISADRIHNGLPADWGSYFWRADFSSLRKPGKYRVVAHVGGVHGESFPFTIGDHAVLRGTGKLGVEFFYHQRCGFEVPGWYRACHLDDARLPDGTHIDATGGWHSAGDYNKIMYENGDGGVAYSLLRVYDALSGYFRQFDRDRDGHPDVIEEAIWGAKFVAKMQNPNTGGLYKDIRQGPGRTWMKWSPPDVHTDNIIGTADDPVIDPGEGYSPYVVVVWTRLGKMLEKQGQPNDWQERARCYWKYMTQKETSFSSPLLLLVALDMHRLTAENVFAKYARRTAEKLLRAQVKEGRKRGAWGDSGEMVAGALASFALAYPQDPLVPPIKGALKEFRVFMESTAENPFGLSKQSVGEKDYFFEPTSALGLNFVQLQKAWACLLIWKLNKDEKARMVATDQIDWVLGKNPYNLCQMEGAGSLNPPRYHHRYDSIPGKERGAVPGAIPNGFVRRVGGEDAPGFDMSTPAPGKRHASYRTSEPWLVHNMWYFLAVSELHGFYPQRKQIFAGNLKD